MEWVAGDRAAPERGRERALFQTTAPTPQPEWLQTQRGRLEIHRLLAARFVNPPSILTQRPQIVSDPANGVVNSQAIPGAQVAYTVQVPTVQVRFRVRMRQWSA